MNFKNINIDGLDAQGMKSQIASLYNQIEESIKILDIFFSSDNRYKNIIKDYNNILIIGMGGSAIGWDFAAKYSAKKAKIPTHILRDYHIPKWVDSRTFVIASSYSGNTEETIYALDKCQSRNTEICIITSGGKLKTIAEENSYNHIIIPGEHPPRAMFGYAFTELFYVLNHYGIIDNSFKSDLVQF